MMIKVQKEPNWVFVLFKKPNCFHPHEEIIRQCSVSLKCMTPSRKKINVNWHQKLTYNQCTVHRCVIIFGKLPGCKLGDVL